MSSSAPGRVGSPSPRSNRRVRPAPSLAADALRSHALHAPVLPLAAAIWPIQFKKKRAAGARQSARPSRSASISGKCSKMAGDLAERACSANFAVVYATTQLGLPKSTMLNAIIIGSLIEVFTIPLFGYISDIVGRRPALLCRRDLHDPVRLPAVLAFRHQECARHRRNGRRRHKLWPRPDVRAAVDLSARAFGTKVRYTGASLGFQVAAAIGGGLSPVLRPR
jgi:hypothetical protein